MSGIGPWWERSLLTEESAKPQRTLLDRVDTFTRRRPDIKIAAPYAVPSRKWEVSVPDQPAQAWDNGTEMMDDLEARYPE